MSEQATVWRRPVMRQASGADGMDASQTQLASLGMLLEFEVFVHSQHRGQVVGRRWADGLDNC